MGKRDYDFAGWVTKSDILCSDGVTIKHDAFRDNDGQKVPLVWNHDYTNPENVLGYVLLQHKETGVYGYGYFNDTPQAQSAKEAIKHGDISSMSIGARKLKRNGSNIIHGSIYEVSLVMVGANPGAMIDSILSHSENGEEEKATIFTGNLIHSGDDVLFEDEGDKDGETIEDVIATMTVKQKDVVHELLNMVAGEGGDPEVDNITHADKTIEDVIKTMNEEQQEAVAALLGIVAEGLENELEQSDKETYTHKGDEGVMKHNVFNAQGTGKNEETLKHGINEVLKQAHSNKVVSFRDMLKHSDIKGADGEVLTHGINSIEMLFPEAANPTNGNTPILFRDTNTQYEEILNSVSKSPFSRVKTLVADITEEEARAKGYIKGNMKKEEFFSLIRRKTEPTTVYKKQKIDRDDVIDITDFDVVSFMNVEMQMMLKEELARAILVGDGRDYADEDKINESNIRPVLTDHEFFTIHKTFADPAAFIEAVIRAMSEYRGSGRPNMYIDPTLLASVKLLRATDGRFLFGDIPSDEAVANRLGVNKIVPTTFMAGNGALIVNLRDYTLGATRGGQITNFDDFDIDFNQYKYLIETRLSGALTQPKSAIHLQEGTTAGRAADDTAGGMTYGTRQAAKTPEEPTA